LSTLGEVFRFWAVAKIESVAARRAFALEICLTVVRLFFARQVRLLAGLVLQSLFNLAHVRPAAWPVALATEIGSLVATWLEAAVGLRRRGIALIAAMARKSRFRSPAFALLNLLFTSALL
jgi:hypothetical protein